MLPKGYGSGLIVDKSGKGMVQVTGPEEESGGLSGQAKQYFTIAKARGQQAANEMLLKAATMKADVESVSQQIRTLDQAAEDLKKRRRELELSGTGFGAGHGKQGAESKAWLGRRLDEIDGLMQSVDQKAEELRALRRGSSVKRDQLLSMGQALERQAESVALADASLYDRRLQSAAAAQNMKERELKLREAKSGQDADAEGKGLARARHELDSFQKSYDEMRQRKEDSLRLDNEELKPEEIAAQLDQDPELQTLRKGVEYWHGKMQRALGNAGEAQGGGAAGSPVTMDQAVARFVARKGRRPSEQEQRQLQAWVEQQGRM
jgi:hypothetical protein